MKSDNAVSVVLSIMLAFILSPVVGILGGLAWYAVGGGGQSAIVFSLIYVATFACIVWKSRSLLRKALDRLRDALPSSAYSGVEIGLAGAFVLGGGMLGGILILGHTRPSSWTFGNVLLAAALGFLVFLIVGVAARKWSKKTEG